MTGALLGAKNTDESSKRSCGSEREMVSGNSSSGSGVRREVTLEILAGTLEDWPIHLLRRHQNVIMFLHGSNVSQDRGNVDVRPTMDHSLKE